MNKVLQTLMDEEGINQDQLSKKTGVHRATLSRIVNRVQEAPSFHSMYKLAKYFDVPVECLYHEELERFGETLPESQSIQVDSTKTITVEIRVS